MSVCRSVCMSFFISVQFCPYIWFISLCCVFVYVVRYFLIDIVLYFFRFVRYVFRCVLRQFVRYFIMSFAFVISRVLFGISLCGVIYVCISVFRYPVRSFALSVCLQLFRVVGMSLFLSLCSSFVLQFCVSFFRSLFMYCFRSFVLYVCISWFLLYVIISFVISLVPSFSFRFVMYVFIQLCYFVIS